MAGDGGDGGCDGRARSRRAGGSGRALWHALGPKKEAVLAGLACEETLVELN